MNYSTLKRMDNNMKLLAKIAFRFNLITHIFQHFPVGACPQTPSRRSALHTLFVYPKVIIFFIAIALFFIAIAFSGPPSNFLPCYAHALRPTCSTTECFSRFTKPLKATDVA